MALTYGTSSLFLYGYTIGSSNNAIDFQKVISGTILTAIVPPGTYSLTDLLTAIATALNTTDGVNTYTVTATRTQSSGTQNRVTIATSGSFLSILFGSGPNIATSVAGTIGFIASNQTGALTYTGTNTTGTALIPTFTGYNYLSPTFKQKLFGTENISSSGKKESISFPAANNAAMQFFQVQFKYEPGAKIIASWQPLLLWMIQQRSFDFTPDTTSPSTFYNCSLETSSKDPKGMEYEVKEMLPDFPGLYDIGLLVMRVNI
jgi:hypothetical protein